MSDKAVFPDHDLCYPRGMLAHIKAFLWDQQGQASAADGRHSLDELRLAAAALLIEAARLDGQLEASELDRVRALLQQRFELSPEELSDLIEEATTATEDSVQLHGFVRQINAHFAHDERVTLIEMLWDVAYADGELHPFEANLLRRVAGLLYVTDQESGAARGRVLRRTGVTGGPENA